MTQQISKNLYGLHLVLHRPSDAANQCFRFFCTHPTSFPVLDFSRREGECFTMCNACSFAVTPVFCVFQSEGVCKLCCSHVFSTYREGDKARRHSCRLASCVTPSDVCFLLAQVHSNCSFFFSSLFFRTHVSPNCASEILSLIQRPRLLLLSLLPHCVLQSYCCVCFVQCTHICVVFRACDPRVQSA